MNPIDKDFILRLLVIVSALISPFVYINIVGELPSISSYWETQMQPLFIIVNASTSYFLFSIKRWKISAILLLFLTAFSVENYPDAHNFFAICFFLMNIHSLYRSRRTHVAMLIYLCSVFFIYNGVLYAEIFAITVLCATHLWLLICARKIDIKRKSHTA
jgi:hypothetical protein